MKAFYPVRTHSTIIACTLLTAVLAFGCARQRLPLMADLSIANTNTLCLKDKIIVIDPGHGGPERGAIGAQGLTEAEVNLTVALHLWGLLKQAGAHPVLTRLSDQALHDAQEFDLAADLALRKTVGTAAEGDLFISIHHNASLDSSKNELIIFYAMDDPYGSRDAARAIAQALQHRLKRDRYSLQAGNYTVLRSRRSPAVLGEASFISNKKNERNLAYTRTLSAEARGYFDGILAYFKKGVPVVRDLKAADPDTANARPPVSACLDPGNEQGQIDISSVTVTVDGQPVRQITAKQNCIAFAPPELANGNHQTCVAFRNIEGNSTRRCIDFTVALPPHRLEITSGFSVLPPESRATTTIDIQVSDRLGRPVLDGTPVALTTSAGTLLRVETGTTDGHARALLAAADQAGAAMLSAFSGGRQAGKQIMFAIPEKALLTLSVRDATGHPISGAALVRETVLAYSDRYGCLQAEIEPAGEEQFQLVRRGYKPDSFTLNTVDGRLTIRNAVLQPIDGGIFFNRTIMLDSKGSSTAAMPVLEKLQNKIENAGGRALFTWQSSTAPPYRKRVMQASAEAADVFMCVDIAGRRCSAGHYHRSEPGLGLAQHLQTIFAERDLTGWRKCAILHSTHDSVLHTSMPAIELILPRKLASKNPEAVAQAMYEALRRWLASPTLKTP